MNGKKKIEETILHKNSGRPACSYEATYEVTEKLIEYFGLDKKDSANSESILASNQPSIAGSKKRFGVDQEIKLQKKLGVDQSIVTCPVNLEKTIGSWWGLPLIAKRENGKILGAWDIVFQEWKYPFGKYIEIHSSPLINATIDEINRVKTPSLDLWDFEAYKKLLVKYQDFFVWLSLGGCFDIARWQRGSEQFFIDLALEPKNAEILLDKVNELAISFLEKCMEKIKGLVEGVYIGDDFGTQKGLVISPCMWRKYIKPRYKKLVSVVKKYGLKYCHHSCGGVRQIIPDMIELGLDVLNPIQPLAIGMDPCELGEEFGKDIAFYGGIDEQKTLPNGSVENVKNEVLHRIKTLGKYRGYIVAPSHAFQPDTPIENVIAVYETVHGKKIY